MNAKQILEVFEAGKTVANPKAWKDGTVKINIILVLISGLIGILNFFDCSFCQFSLSPDQQVGIATGIMTIAGLFNAGSTVATSDKVGFEPKNVQPVSEDLSNDIKDLQ